MQCVEVHPMLRGYAAGELEPAARADVRAHLVGCPACRQAAADLALGTALVRGLPRWPAPAGLQQRLRARLQSGAPVPDGARPIGPWRARLIPGAIGFACAAALLVAVAGVGRWRAAPAWTLADEVVSDHLRVAASTHPVEVESGGIHQVKPWFTGRVDFAPRITFSGDDDFPLIGGSVGYVRDRRAAVFTFRRRLHLITLMIFPVEDLPWPQARPRRIGSLDIVEEDRRGFSVLFWRAGGLGYALVSDVNRADLESLAQRIDPR